jgi:STE24 endopeptidase
MNFIAAIILVTITANTALHFGADILNLRVLGRKLPESFKDVYDETQYQKSQDYLRATTRFGFITEAVNLLVLLLFWFLGGFAQLDLWVRSLEWGPVPSGLVYIGLLALVYALLMQPFSLYSTFVIEQKFGFNKTTGATYVSDLAKGLGLSVLLGMPLLAAILAFFEYVGTWAWLYCWIGVTGYMLVIQFIAPTWIMPLFNRFTAIEDGDLKKAILAYAHSINFSLKNVFVMDGSKRSGKSNAFFTGFGKNRRIVLFDTLIEKHTTRELVAILAHEMGHYKKHHIIQSLAIGICQMGIIFFLLSLCLSFQGLFNAFYMNQTSVYAGLIFFSMLYSPMDFFMEIFMQGRSRKNEYEADRFAVQTTGDPEAMAAALKKLSVHNLSNLMPHPFYVFLNYSHPPVMERLRAIRMEAVTAG